LPPGDQLNYVLDRLRQLGATYYLLETCGNEKREFRFYCKMAVGGNRGMTQPFWCIDSEPLKAMTAVLQQVQDGKAAAEKAPKRCKIPSEKPTFFLFASLAGVLVET